MIERPLYLEKLIRKMNNDQVKVITGSRRVGKSFLLFEIFHDYLNSVGVDDAHIIELSLEDDINAQYRNPLKLGEYVRELIIDDGKTNYVFLDEIQKVAEIKNPYVDNSSEKITFVDTVLGLMKIKNVDLYITGSNSRMLSKDILTEFRGRGDEIRVLPLTYKEYYNAYSGDKNNALRDYMTYGGMPYLMSLETHEDKNTYLSSLFDNIYIRDILDRHNIGYDKVVLDVLLDILASSIGSLTNPLKLSNTFNSVAKIQIGDDTITKYLEYFSESFLINCVSRFDIKGRKHIGSPYKYYYTDLGLRNARLNFRQIEYNHIMENAIYNELIARGYSVNVGNVTMHGKDENGKSFRKQLEVDFVATNVDKTYYIQSAYSIESEEKRLQEINSLKRISDSFEKIVVVKDNIIPWHDENGIQYIGLQDFLLK